MARAPREARAAREIGDGGIIGWLAPESIDFPDDGQPTLAYTALAYKVSGAVQDSCNLAWDTTMTAAEVRSLAKDTIQSDVIAKMGITVPKSAIKMLNAPE